MKLTQSPQSVVDPGIVGSVANIWRRL